MDGDGNVYFMAEDDEHLTVYRVGTEIRAYELAFDSCAELALRLSWGKGENEVFILSPNEGPVNNDWVIPEHFNIIDGKIYVYDRFSPHGNGILECDPATGSVTRLSPDIGDSAFYNGEFAVLDGRLIFGAYMFDLETGERTELQRIPNSDQAGSGILIMSVKDGKCFAYRAVNYDEDRPGGFMFTQATIAYDEYELDFESRLWVLKRRIEMPENVPHADPHFTNCSTTVHGGWIEMMGEDGALFCYDRYMGTDDAGNHYIDSEEELAEPNEGGGYTATITLHRIIKLSPDGTPLSYVDVYFPDNYIHMWLGTNYLVYKVDGDGTVWYMCETEEECQIYKISL